MTAPQEGSPNEAKKDGAKKEGMGAGFWKSGPFWSGVIVTVIGGLVVVLLALKFEALGDRTIGPLWVAGGAGLGLLTGLTTGLAGHDGVGKEYLKLVVTGVLAPLLTGIGALLVSTTEVSEQSTYENEQLIEKTTTTVRSLGDGALHPLAVLGAFFVSFSIFAIVGIVAGALLRNGGFEVRSLRGGR